MVQELYSGGRRIRLFSPPYSATCCYSRLRHAEVTQQVPKIAPKYKSPRRHEFLRSGMFVVSMLAQNVVLRLWDGRFGIPPD